MAEFLELLPAADCRWDLVALGEVMLRLDPGDERISTTRSFRVWEGGGEYNVARGLRRCFGLRTAIVTALADNAVGRLVEDLMLQGGVDTSQVRWLPYDAIGRTVRNGLNFTERGFGIRGALGCSDRGHTAVSQLRRGDVEWDAVFAGGVRWFHCGGIFAGLSETTPEVAEEAMKAARAAGAIVSWDLNYRPSLWAAAGGRKRAIEVNRHLTSFVDVMFGNEEDFSVAFGYDTDGVGDSYRELDPLAYRAMLEDVTASYPNLKLVATSLRVVHSANTNDWSGLCYADGTVHASRNYSGLEILDRVGGGDSFASGMIYGLLQGLHPADAVEYAAAHGALAMTTPGDTSTATLAEVERLVAGVGARVQR